MTDLDILASNLLFTSSEEVAERFAEAVGLVLEHLAVHGLEASVFSLDVRYEVIKIVPG
jgi:hypothetical protein